MQIWDVRFSHQYFANSKQIWLHPWSDRYSHRHDQFLLRSEQFRKGLPSNTRKSKRQYRWRFGAWKSPRAFESHWCRTWSWPTSIWLICRRVRDRHIWRWKRFSRLRNSRRKRKHAQMCEINESRIWINFRWILSKQHWDVAKIIRRLTIGLRGLTSLWKGRTISQVKIIWWSLSWAC